MGRSQLKCPGSGQRPSRGSAAAWCPLSPSRDKPLSPSLPSLQPCGPLKKIYLNVYKIWHGLLTEAITYNKHYFYMKWDAFLHFLSNKIGLKLLWKYFMLKSTFISNMKCAWFNMEENTFKERFKESWLFPSNRIKTQRIENKSKSLLPSINRHKIK